VTRIRQISFNPSSSLGYLANVDYGLNSLRTIKQYYVFAGQASSYSTQYQTFRFESDLTNSFVMKYLFDKDTNYQCIYEAGLTKTSYTADTSEIRRVDAEYRQTTSQIIQQANYFRIYSSPYSGAFDLLDTMYIPRPCASAYANLTQMDYFYG
jgi:hypothetical protein